MNSTNHFTALGIAWYDGSVASVELRNCGFRLVESQPPLDMFWVGSMTCEALVSQNRPHVAIEIDRVFGGRERANRNDRIQDQE